MQADLAKSTNYRLHLTPTLIVRLGIWIVVSILVSIILFQNSRPEFQVVFSNGWLMGEAHFLIWFLLLIGLVFLWFMRKKVWRDMNPELSDKEAAAGLLQRMFSIDLIIMAVLILAAYPLPQSPELLVFRLLAVVLAGFVLTFGRQAAKIPALVLANYGFTLLIMLVSNNLLNI